MDKPDDKAVRTFTIDDVREDKLPSEEIMQSGAAQEEEAEDEADIVVGAEAPAAEEAPAEAEAPAEEAAPAVDETPTEQLTADMAPDNGAEE